MMHKLPERRPQAHLIHILKNTQDHHPNFMLLLGAGASQTSGVKTARAMISSWRAQYHYLYAADRDADAFLAEQDWYNSASEYSVLFEALYDHPSQRREFIESCLDDARPSWGYIYLVNLLRKRVFNTVFTTNFDDLLNEACYLFSGDVRPLVCAHDSSIRSLRISAKRPKIVKLHGDFLFDSIKNTVRELETLEDNMREKFRQFAREFGLIVLGYSGNDRSIMDTLGTLMRSDDNYPHGVYWCVRKGAALSAPLQKLARFPRFNFIEIDGFDEFFAELHDGLSLELQLEMSDPYKALANRLNSLISSAQIPSGEKAHPIIERAIELLGEKIRQTSTRVTVVEVTADGKAKDSTGSSVPWILLAQIAFRRGNTDEAARLIGIELKREPTTLAFAVAFDILKQRWMEPLGANVMAALRAARHIYSANPNMLFSLGCDAATAKQFDTAREIFEMVETFVGDPSTQAPIYLQILTINKAMIKKFKGEPLTEREREQLESIVAEYRNKAEHLAALVLLGKFPEAVELGKSLMARPGFALYMTLDELPVLRLLPQELVEQILAARTPTLSTGPQVIRPESSSQVSLPAGTNGSRPNDNGNDAGSGSEALRVVPTEKALPVVVEPMTVPESSPTTDADPLRDGEITQGS